MHCVFIIFSLYHPFSVIVNDDPILNLWLKKASVKSLKEKIWIIAAAIQQECITDSADRSLKPSICQSNQPTAIIELTLSDVKLRAVPLSHFTDISSKIQQTSYMRKFFPCEVNFKAHASFNDLSINVLCLH